MTRSFLLAITLLGAGGPAALGAQSLDSIPQPPVPEATTIRWWHAAAAVGGLSALMLVDHPVQRYAQHNSGTGADNVASAVRHFGQPEVYGTLTLGLLAAGLITRTPEVTRSGGRLAASLLLAGGGVLGGKMLLGRPRPEQSLDADGYSPFSGQAAMPSGHAAVAFAIATSLSDDIHRTWVSVPLYGLAAAVGWSRINDNRHWLTDVTAGALVGITSAKLASGRWRIFGLRPPSVLLGSGGSGLGWQAEF